MIECANGRSALGDKDAARSRFAAAFHVCVVLAATLTLFGCARAQAKAIPLPPPLDVPQAPPRIIEATDAELPAPVGLVNDPARAQPPRPRPTTAPPARADAPKIEGTKPELPAEAAKGPEDSPRPQPPTTLQTTPTQREGEVEARIRTLLVRATTDLSRVNYQNLGNNSRTQYDTAKGFIKQADDALKARNLLFASSLADKAAALAAQLAGR